MASTEQLKLLAKQLLYLNVPQWQANGITGNGINILLPESETDHSTGEYNFTKEILPNANVYFGNYTYSNGIHNLVQNNVNYTPEEFIETFDVNLITRSVGGKALSTDAIFSPFWNDLKHRYKLVMNNSAGNYGTKGCNAAYPSDVAIYWGAVGLNTKGKPIIKTYSSRGEQIKFVMFTGYLEGTSFASPIGTALEGMLKQRYDINMSQEEIEQYFKFISKDLGVVGFDTTYGNGLPILPDWNRRYIQLDINSLSYRVDGEIKTLPSEPVIINDSTYVPVRAVSEGLGKTVVWNENTKTVTISDTTKTLNYTLGQNGVYRTPTGVTMIPIRLVVEEFGCKVAYIGKYKRVVILEV